MKYPLEDCIIRELPVSRDYATNNYFGKSFPYIFVIPNSSKWVILWAEGDRHESGPHDRLRLADSYDNGHTMVNQRTLITGQSYGTVMTCGMMNGRLGIICLQEGATSIFWWSDDQGQAWNSRILNTTVNYGYFDEIRSYPSSVGGDDANGFITYGCYVPSTNSIIKYLKTVDNGDTWIEGNTTITPSDECTIARVGTQNKWVMIIRSAGNALAAKSTDMINWTGPYDTGQPNNNPLQVIAFNDKFYWTMTHRLESDVPSFGFGRSSLLHQWANAENIWNTSGKGWPGWEVLSYVPDYARGYLRVVQDNKGLYHGLFNAGGDAPVGQEKEQHLYLITQGSKLSATDRFVGASVQRSSDLVIPSGVDTGLTYDVQYLNTNKIFNPAFPARLTIPFEGIWKVGGLVRFDFNPVGSRKLIVVRNGTFKLSEKIIPASTTQPTEINIDTAPFQGHLEDFIELYANQDSGGDLLVKVYFTAPQLWIYLIGR